MSIDFSGITAVSDQKGVVTQIADAAGNVLWAFQSDKPVILEVEKITSDTYASETTYSSEEFILLDIYPKTNGTVKVTYGGLTKTITDTSGAEEPNAQQVFFGTFNGVSDETETPASGTLTIEGGCRAFGIGTYAKSTKNTNACCCCVTGVSSFGNVEYIPDNAFSGGLSGCEITSVEIPNSVKSIGRYAFAYSSLTEAIIHSSVIHSGAFSGCTGLTSVTLSNKVTDINTDNLDGAFRGCTGLTSLVIPKSVVNIGCNPVEVAFETNILTVEDGNPAYHMEGNCLIETATNRLVSGFADSTIPETVTSIGIKAFNSLGTLASVVIPSGVTSIDSLAFNNCDALTTITIPANVNFIGASAFTNCDTLKTFVLLATTPPTLGGTIFTASLLPNVTILVPTGTGDTYKAADGWSDYADYITEAS